MEKKMIYDEVVIRRIPGKQGCHAIGYIESSRCNLTDSKWFDNRTYDEVTEYLLKNGYYLCDFSTNRRAFRKEPK